MFKIILYLLRSTRVLNIVSVRVPPPEFEYTLKMWIVVRTMVWYGWHQTPNCSKVAPHYHCGYVEYVDNHKDAGLVWEASNSGACSGVSPHYNCWYVENVDNREDAALVWMASNSGTCSSSKVAPYYHCGYVENLDNHEDVGLVWEHQTLGPVPKLLPTIYGII